MREGMENTCRFCKEPIIVITPSQFKFKDPDNPLKGMSTFWGTRQYWIHKETEKGECYEGKRNNALPRTICWSELGSSFHMRCETKIAADNVVAERYACGRHMKGYMAHQKEAEWAKEREIAQQEREALEEWRKGEYARANETLRTEFGAVDLLGDYTPSRFGGRVERKVSVDLLELLAWATMLRTGEVTDGDLQEEAEAEASDHGEVPWE